MAITIEAVKNPVERYKIKVSDVDVDSQWIFAGPVSDHRRASQTLYSHYCRVCERFPELPAGAVAGLVSGEIPIKAASQGYIKFSYPVFTKSSKPTEIPLEAMSRTYVIESRVPDNTALSQLKQARLLYANGMPAAGFYLLSTLLGQAPAGAVPGLLDETIEATPVIKDMEATGDFEFVSPDAQDIRVGCMAIPQL